MQLVPQDVFSLKWCSLPWWQYSGSRSAIKENLRLCFCAGGLSALFFFFQHTRALNLRLLACHKYQNNFITGHPPLSKFSGAKQGNSRSKIMNPHSAKLARSKVTSSFSMNHIDVILCTQSAPSQQAVIQLLGCVKLLQGLRVNLQHKPFP